MYINYCNDPVLEEKQENQSSINNTDLDLGALDITSELYTRVTYRHVAHMVKWRTDPIFRKIFEISVLCQIL